MATSTASAKLTRDRYRSGGRCVQCGAGERASSGLLCPDCVEYVKMLRAIGATRRKLKVFAHYGRVCVFCGHDHQHHLTIDHVEGGGNKQRAEAGVTSGNAFYAWLIRQGFPPEYQTLCFNCNFLKWRGDSLIQPIKLEVLAHYGDSCSICEHHDIRCLCLDHVNGGGNDHRRSLGYTGGSRFYSWLKRSGFPSEYRTLCYNCNSGGEVELAQFNRPDRIFRARVGKLSSSDKDEIVSSLLGIRDLAGRFGVHPESVRRLRKRYNTQFTTDGPISQGFVADSQISTNTLTEKVMGQRALTRRQRVEVATLLIEAAKMTSPSTTAMPAATRAQLGAGLSLLSSGKLDHKVALTTAGLSEALKDQSTIKPEELATAWELEVFPMPVPANKKVDAEPAPAKEVKASKSQKPSKEIAPETISALVRDEEPEPAVENSEVLVGAEA